MFSEALIAFVESHIADDSQRNALCNVVPGQELPHDWMQMWAVTLANTARRRAHPGLNAWLKGCRLNAKAVIARGVAPEDRASLA